MSAAADILASVMGSAALAAPAPAETREPGIVRLPDFAPYFQKPEKFRGYYEMEAEDYHRYPAVNAGLLANATPAEMLHSLMAREPAAPTGDDDEDLENVQEQKKALILGSLTHAIILEPWKFSPDHFDKYFFKFTATKGLASKKAKEAIRDNPGKLLVTPELLETAHRIRKDAFETNEYAQELLNTPDGMREATGLAWDPGNLIMRKIRPDYLPRRGNLFGNYILDIKTTRKPLHLFPKECWSLGYYTQAAWYLDTHHLITGLRPDMFVWLVVSNDPKKALMSRLFFMLNRDSGKNGDGSLRDPLYEFSTIRKARETLGLDRTAAIGRLAMFADAARNTLAAKPEDMTPLNVRRLWTGYEGESPMFEIL